MKQEDLKVGMVIKSSGCADRTTLSIGGSMYFYSWPGPSGDIEEGIASLQYLGYWEPVEPESELYYRWIVKVPTWHSPISYYCETGHDTNGHSFHNWDNIEKRIRLDIAPIDKNGREHPKGQR